jgi:hypothetical protein
MSFDLQNKIAHCHRRAAECRELAVRYGAIDRGYYSQEERAWLKLALSYEIQERLDRVLKELESRADLPIIPIAPPQDPSALQ